MGEKTIARMVDAGFTTLERIYELTEIDLVTMGFGPGQTPNILAALRLSLSTLVEDARFLSALGIRDLGIGESRRLLTHYRLSQVYQITSTELEKIKGFGPITSISITEGLAARAGTLSHLLSMGFNIEVTPLLSEQVEIESPIAGKNLVFTGKMTGMTRDEMKRLAREKGANVQSAVSKTTDLLIAGEKAGSKLAKAEKLGVNVLSESEWQRLIG
jgi:DNA ligase (NAD+)